MHYYFLAGAPAFLSPCHRGLAPPHELSFSCDGEFGVGVRGSADDVDDDIADDIGDGFGVSIDYPQKVWSCQDRGLLTALVEEPPLYFILLLPLRYYRCCIVVVVAPTVADD